MSPVKHCEITARDELLSCPGSPLSMTDVHSITHRHDFQIGYRFFFSHVSLPFDLFRERPLSARDHFVNIVRCLLFPSLRKLLLINHTSLDQRSNLSSYNHFRGQILFFKITTGFDCLEFPVSKHLLIRTWHSKPATQARGEAPRVDRGSGGTPFYKPYRYVSPHRVGFLPRFGLKRVYTLPISPFPVFWITAPPKL